MTSDVPSTIEAPRRGCAEPDADGDPLLRISLIEHVPADGIDTELLARAARAAFESGSPGLGGDTSYEVTLVFSDDEELRGLNRQWRGKDAPTNVLSFPSGEETAMPGEALSLGDIVLSVDTLTREAAELGIPLQNHAVHLAVHGVLHLIGFDHEDEEDAARMEDMEISILATFGIADPYGALERDPDHENE